MKKTFLTSGLILGLAISPAIADTLYNTDIADSCTADILGSSSGNAVNSFTAQYAPNKYTSAAGTYLLFSNGEISENQTCPTGSFCPGFTDVDFADATMGLNTCPTIDSVAFTSASGSSAITNCYEENTAMSSALLNPFTTEHLNTSKNTDGYINGVKYASASTVARRYATSTTAAGDWTALDESDIQITDLACNTGYHYKAAQANPLANVDVSIGGDDYNKDNSTMTWNTTFSYGNITGKARCATNRTEYYNGIGVPEGTEGLSPEETAGLNCWCQIDGYTPVGGSKQSLSGAWVFEYDGGTICAYDCADRCANNMRNNIIFRAAMFGSVGASPAICEANEITVTWDQANGQGSVTNTCTYDGDITLPTAPEKTGYTFSGWKLVEPSSSNE